LFDNFVNNESLSRGDWAIVRAGTGTVEAHDGLHLKVTGGDNLRAYHNAQICDYGGLHGWTMKWQPPLRMTVTAWADQPYAGTAGFGFWNHPFSPDARRLPRLPAAIWFFFAAPPNDMRLALDVAGHGWKASTLDAAHLRAAALAPTAPALMLLMRAPSLYRRLWRRIQPILKVSERALDPALLGERHTYRIDWLKDGARWYVDDRLVLESPYSPRGALGFVAWIDNQYAVAVPKGIFGWGITPLTRAQSLHIDDVRIEPL